MPIIFQIVFFFASDLSQRKTLSLCLSLSLSLLFTTYLNNFEIFPTCYPHLDQITHKINWLQPPRDWNIFLCYL